VLLSAPAGAGKTVLLSSWIAARRLPGPPCWLSLDDDHNDISRLFDDLLSSLRGVPPITRSRALSKLTPLAGTNLERSLALLINGLAGLRSPVVLVLDDVHELTNPQSTTAIDFLVRHAPSQLRLVLAGRTDPPLPIERLRVSEDLTELRIADLAFDRKETAELCRQLDLTLSAQDTDLLWERTEGWVAAVRLAALSLHGHPEPRRFLAEFAGTDRAVADYLISEVLTRMPQEHREFMLRTSLVDTLSPELADILTEREGARLTLAELEHLGAPLQPTTAGGNLYRYHPLFRELLRAHLRHSHAQQIPALHRGAANWYAQQQQMMPAIRHALAGEDWQHASRLITEHWLELFLLGGAGTMRGPMTQLPATIIESDARLAAAFAGSRLQDGDLQGAERYLSIARHARGGTPAQARKSLEMLIGVVALRHARLCGHIGDAERFARKLAIATRAHTHHCWIALRSFALCDLGATRLWSGDAEAATTVLNEALALATEHRHEQIALDCIAQLAIVHALRGELTRAAELSSRAVELAEQCGLREGPGAASAQLVAAACSYQRGQFERATCLLKHAAAAADTAEAPVRVAVGLLQALTLATAGHDAAAGASLKLRAIRSGLTDGEPASGFLRLALEYAEPRVLMAAGELAEARQALAQARKRSPECAALLVSQAGIELRDGEHSRARESLTLSRSAQVHPAILVEGWLLQALLEQATSDLPAAAQALDRALAVAEREPFRDAFLLNGPQVQALLELQATTGTAHPALLEVLLDDIGDNPTVATSLPEPLTEREQQILRYLPTMLTNAEIGAEMFVSLNTVKTHLRSIYRKLDANGRADAVEQARRRGLLPVGIKRPRAVQRV
jgi:LuxR family maltose regulon positive regulatory protein